MCTVGNDHVISNVIYTIMLGQHRPVLCAQFKKRIWCVSSSKAHCRLSEWFLSWDVGLLRLVFPVLHRGGTHTCTSVQQQQGRSTKLLKTQWHFTYNVTRVRRVNHGVVTYCTTFRMLTENLKTSLTEEFVSSPVACSSYLMTLFLFHYFHRRYENIQNWSAVNKC